MSTVAVVSNFMFVAGARAALPTEATREFLDARPGAVAMFENDRIVAVYGPTLAEKIDPTTSSADFLSTFLTTPVASTSAATNLEAITGYTGVQLVFQREDLVGRHPANPDAPKFRVLTYGQTIAGLEVHGAIFKAVFFLGASETIPLFNVGVVPPPVGPLPVDSVSSQEAIAAAAAHPLFSHLTQFANPEKVIYEDHDGKLHRAWRIHGSGPGDGYWFFVDTSTGLLVGVQKVVDDYIPIHGTVRGYGVNGTAADDPWELIPIPGALVEARQGFPSMCPSQAGALLDTGYAQFGPMEGFYELNFTVGGRVVSRLTSPYTTVHDCSAFSQDDQCLAQATLPPGQWLPTDLLACQDISLGSPVDPIFNPAANDEPATAQVTIFHGIQRTYDWFRRLHPAYTGLDWNVVALANYPDSCNAFYDTIGRFTAFYRSAGVCRNRGLSRTIVSHEYGHFIVRSLLHYSVSPITNEGLADTIASFVWDTPVHGENADSACSLSACTICCQNFVRHLDWVDSQGVEQEVLFDRNESLPCWCRCGAGTVIPHCRSLALSQALWDMRKNFIALNPGNPQAGKDAADRLLGDFLFITDGKWDRSLLIELLIADDDDGTLATPTPRTASIIQSFTFRHRWGPVSLGIDDGTVHVDWEGPAGGSPVQGTDYYVYYNVDPPSVVLKTTIFGLDFVDRYIVRRYDANDQPLDLGRVTAEWDGVSANDIRVAIGEPLPDDPLQRPRCNNLQTLDIPSQSNNNYSSAVLTLAGNLTVRATVQTVQGTCINSGNAGDACRMDVQCPGGTCFLPPNFGAGGRLSGSISGHRGLIQVEAIGLNDVQPGELYISEMPHVLDGGGEIILSRHNAGSLLDIDDSDRRLTIRGPLHGAVRYGALRSLNTFNGFEGSPWGGWRGSVNVLGSGTSTGRIVMDDPDGGLEGGTIFIAGSLAGDIELSRMQPFTPVNNNYSAYPKILIGGTLSGTLTIGTMDPATPPGDVEGEPLLIKLGRLNGTIRIQDDLVGELVIDGPGVSYGDIIVDGAILGTIRIDSGFGGEICAANLAPGGRLPSNIVICSFAIGATVCGAPPNLGIYGDVAPPPNGNGQVNLDDILYVLSCFGSVINFPYGDIAPCGGNGLCNLDDILAVLGAFSGNYACGVPCD